MEGGGAASISAEKASESAAAASYSYWIREVTHEAAPLPLPKKLNPEDLSNQSNKTHLGSAWNGARTWEEKSLNKWATDRIKELLVSMGCLEFSGGRAEVSEVTKCSGDMLERLDGHLHYYFKINFQAFLVTVRNKKRVGYTYELTLKVKGEWLVGGEKKKVKGHIDVFEFSLGELDDLQIVVKLGEDKDVPQQEKQQICQDLKLFLQPLREKLLQFEQEIKDRRG